MQRSTTQVLYRYLPDSVFAHEDGFYARVHHVNGRSVTSEINKMVLLGELADELARWQPDQVGIPNPRTNPDEYVILKPEEVVWDVYPLTFECTNSNCGRIRRWWRQDKLLDDTAAAGQLRCTHCGSKLRQLRYLTAHNCGAMDPLHTPGCPNCQKTEDMYLEDLGSFRSSSWRCRACGAAQSTRFTPCDCGTRYARNGQHPFRRGYTARDQRLWYPQTLTIVNIFNQTYDNFQRHPDRGAAALASWLGDQESIATSLAELDRGGSGTRQSASEWTATEAALRERGIDDERIAIIRAQIGPATTGASVIAANVPAEVVAMAAQLPMVERAGLFDRNIIEDRRSFDDVRRAATGPARLAADTAAATMAALGIEDISVTQRFPIVVASYGYTRATQKPGEADLRTYAKPRQYNGKTPIFAVPANTEALLVTLDAKVILEFLHHEGLWGGTVPVARRDARLALAEILAADPTPGSDTAAGLTRRLVHSASHALVRALDDGQSGFGESSLAEWIVPDALTCAVYVASYNDFTLGALDTVQRRRIAPWLNRAADDVQYCDNDPLCSQTSPHRPHAACDRCLHLSFGCRTWNADLDRKLLRRFWLWTRQRPTTHQP